MKKMISILLAICVLSTLSFAASVTSSAEATTGFVIDGKLDSLYSNESPYHGKILDCYSTSDGTSPISPVNEGQVWGEYWTAWDSNYIYVYLKAHDKVIKQAPQPLSGSTYGAYDCFHIWMDPDPSTQGMMPDGKTDDPKTGNWQWFFSNAASPNQGDSMFCEMGYDLALFDYHQYFYDALLSKSSEINRFKFDDGNGDTGYGCEIRYPRVANEKNYQFNINIVTSEEEFSDGWVEPAYSVAIGPAWWISYAGMEHIQFIAEPGDEKYPFKSADQKITDLITAIDALPAAADITADNAAATLTAATALKTTFDSFTAEEQAKVTNAQKLTDVIAACNAVQPAIKYGDVNSDGKINTTDALLALRAAIGKITFSEAQNKIADVNGDSKINTTDALQILKKAVNSTYVFPVEQK